MTFSGCSMASGAEKDREHWRFVSVQTRGCLSVTRRSDKQREQQLQRAGYLAMRECGIVGWGTLVWAATRQTSQGCHELPSAGYEIMIRTRQTAAKRLAQLVKSRAGPALLYITMIRTPNEVQDPDKIPLSTARASRTPADRTRIYTIIRTYITTIRMMMKKAHGHPRVGRLAGRCCVWA